MANSGFSGDEKGRLTRLEKVVYGNGRPGLVDLFSEHRSEFQTFRTVWENREDDKKIYDDRQSRRLNTLLGVAGVLIALASAIIALLLYEHETHHALFHPPALYQSNQSAQAQAVGWFHVKPR